MFKTNIEHTYFMNSLKQRIFLHFLVTDDVALVYDHLLAGFCEANGAFAQISS